MSLLVRLLLMVVAIKCHAHVIPLGTYTIGLYGTDFDVEYIFNFTAARFGVGCQEGFIPAIIPRRINISRFLEPVPTEMVRQGCFTAGERTTPINSNPIILHETQIMKERTEYEWWIYSRAIPIQNELWFRSEPGIKGAGNNYVKLDPNGGIINAYDTPLPHCCMKVSKDMTAELLRNEDEETVTECNPPCADGRGRCVEGSCVCKGGYEGRSCDSVICPGGHFGFGCSVNCECGDHAFCFKSSFKSRIPMCDCHPGYTTNGLRCNKPQEMTETTPTIEVTTTFTPVPARNETAEENSKLNSKTFLILLIGSLVFVCLIVILMAAFAWVSIRKRPKPAAARSPRMVH